MDYISILKNLVESQAHSIEQEDYEAFMGFAQDAENDSYKEKCIENFLKMLAADQAVSIEEVSLIDTDANDLFDLFGEG